MISEENFDKIEKEQSEGRQVSSMRIRLSARRIQEASEAAGSSVGRYSLRGRTGTQGRSSLESLPVPEISNQRRRSHRRRASVTDNSRELQTLRSQGRNDETDVLGQMSTLRAGRLEISGVDPGIQGTRTRLRTRTQINLNENEIKGIKICNQSQPT